MSSGIENDESFLYVLRQALKFIPIRNLGIKDILFDPATLTVALTGDAVRIETNVLKKSVANYNERLNFEWASLFGIKIQKLDYGTRPQWFHGDPDIFIADFVEALEDAIRDAAFFLSGDKPVGDEELNLTIIPEPGYPWSEGTTDRIYSAKKGKWIKAETPPWLSHMKDRDGVLRPSVDFCHMTQRIDAPLVDGLIGNIDGTEYIVTHATGLLKNNTKIGDERINLMAQCRGMLFPSFATGLVPAANFGETILCVNASLPLYSMKPYKKHGAWPVVTYPTDVWTETTGEMLADASIEAFAQLHQSVNLYYTNHMHVLGPVVKEEGFGGEEVKPITSTSKLASGLRRKFKIWTRDMSYDRFQKISNEQSLDRYGYMETKANAIVDWNMIPYAVCPAGVDRDVSKQLAKIGFTGELVTVEVDQEMLRALTVYDGKQKPEIISWLQYQYAWIVSDAIRQFGNVSRVEVA